MKKQIIATAIFIFAVMGGYLVYLDQRAPKTLQDYFGVPEYESVDPKQPLNQQTATVQIGERTFKIPSIYIQTDLRGQHQQDGLNLLYVLPDFTSMIDFKNRQEYYKADKQRRFAHMQIQRLGIKAPLEIALRNHRNSLSALEKGDDFKGLEKEIWYRKNNNNKDIPDSEVFIEKNTSGEVVSYIDCSTYESGSKFPGCSHRFFDKNLYYAASFNKEKYLPSWREHKKKAIAFIDQFEIHTKP